MVPENWHICVNKGITYLLKKTLSIANPCSSIFGQFVKAFSHTSLYFPLIPPNGFINGQLSVQIVAPQPTRHTEGFHHKGSSLLMIKSILVDVQNEIMQEAVSWCAGNAV